MYFPYTEISGKNEFQALFYAYVCLSSTPLHTTTDDQLFDFFLIFSYGF
jgi:hypothetical protein